MSRPALLLGLLLVGCTRDEALSVCDIVENSEKYSGSYVNITAVFRQGNHGAVLADSKCPELRIALGSEVGENKPFQDAVWANYLADGRVITASIGGTYIYTPAPYPGRLLDNYTVKAFHVGQPKSSL